MSAVEQVPAGDGDEVSGVREVLSRHARSRSGCGWSDPVSLTHTVVSALVEDPELFAEPLPPLRELLPLPEDLRPQDVGADQGAGTRQVVAVPLSLAVHRELARRADRIYESLPDHLSMLLCAVAHRVQPSPRDRYGRDLYDGPYVSPGGHLAPREP